VFITKTLIYKWKTFRLMSMCVLAESPGGFSKRGAHFNEPNMVINKLTKQTRLLQKRWTELKETLPRWKGFQKNTMKSTQKERLF